MCYYLPGSLSFRVALWLLCGSCIHPWSRLTRWFWFHLGFDTGIW